MSDDLRQAPDFESVKTRLAEIADAVEDEGLSLDAALDLYEEAVALGLQASDLLEIGIAAPEEPAGDDQASGHADGAPNGEGLPAPVENEPVEQA